MATRSAKFKLTGTWTATVSDDDLKEMLENEADFDVEEITQEMLDEKFEEWKSDVCNNCCDDPSTNVPDDVTFDCEVLDD